MTPTCDLENPQKTQPVVSSQSQQRSLAPTLLHLPGGTHGVLLFHGLSSSSVELIYLARGLNREGYTVKTPVIDGYTHGTTSLHANGFKRWARAALEAFDEMKKYCHTVSVGGLCIGSLLALYVASRRPDQTAAVLCMSTTLNYDGWANPWTRHLLPLVNYVPFGGRIRVREREPFGVKNVRLRAYISKQMTSTKTSDAGAAHLKVQNLIEAQRLAHTIRKSLHAILAPTLLIHAKDDEIASPKSSYEVAKGISSARVKIVLLSNCYHMISIDQERSLVLHELKIFITDQVIEAKQLTP